MSTLLEFECRVPVDGYRIMVFDERKFEGAQFAHPETHNMLVDENGVLVEADYSVLPPSDATEDERYLLDKWGMHIVPDVSSELMIEYGIEPEVREILEPKSDKVRRFDLFKEASSPFLEFVNAPLKGRASSFPFLKLEKTPLKRRDVETAKVLADRFGPLHGGGPQYVDQWVFAAQQLRQAVTKWEKAKETGDFSSIIQFISRQGRLEQKHGVIFESEVGRIDANILLRERPADGAALLCIRPTTLLNALWTQLALAINGSQSLRTCVECKKWFAIESDRGRSDKEYCSDACRMRAYRKRKGQQ
jgi:hypothetical protein